VGINVSDQSKASKSRDIFESIFKNSGALICLCDENGKILHGNLALCERTGLAENLLTQKNIRSLYPAADLEHITNAVQKQGQWTGELKYQSIDGQSFWYQTIITKADNHLLWTQMDITEQKQKERHQRKNEQKLHSLLNNIPAYIFTKDREGRYTFANQMLAALHALTTDDLIGKTDFDLFTKDAAQTFTKNDKTVFERNKTVRALEHGGMDDYGIERSYLSVKCPLEDEDGIVNEILGISVDISEQQRLERALWESQEKLNSILDNMKARVYIKDTDLRYTYANEELCQELQMDRTTIMGKDDFDLFATESAIAFRTTDQEVLDTKQKIFRMETSSDPFNREKRYFWSVKVPLMTAEGVPHSILGISTDVTEQKKLEERLRSNERQLTTVLDNIQAHVYIKDVSSTYTYVNANMCDYLGMAQDDVIGKTDKEIFGEKVASRFHQSDRQVFDYRENCTSIEKSSHFRTGEKCYFLSVKAPLINDVGNASALIGISTDVSEQQRMERELRELA